MVARLSTFASDVIAVPVTGISTATAVPVVATDNVVVAIGKLQAQVNTKTGGTSNSQSIMHALIFG